MPRYIVYPNALTTSDWVTKYFELFYQHVSNVVIVAIASGQRFFCQNVNTFSNKLAVNVWWHKSLSFQVIHDMSTALWRYNTRSLHMLVILFICFRVFHFLSTECPTYMYLCVARWAAVTFIILYALSPHLSISSILLFLLCTLTFYREFGKLMKAFTIFRRGFRCNVRASGVCED